MAAADGQNREAAAALADLFFLPGPSLTDADKLRANEARRRYRDWRTSGTTAPPADALDLNHEALTKEKRSTAKMKRVKTVGGRLQDMSPVCVPPPLIWTHARRTLLHASPSDSFGRGEQHS